MLEVEDGFLRCLFFQLDRFTGDGHHLAGLIIRRVAGGDHFQAYLRAFRATDQLDHFIQAPADHVDHFLAALCHTDDLVGRGDLLALFRRACRYQAHNLDVFVVALQYGTNTFERQAHIDIEVFRVVRRQVGGVRVVGHGKGVDVSLEHVFAAGLLEARELVVVALGQQLLNRLGLFAGDFQAQDFVFNTLAPEVIEFGKVLDPGGVLAVDQQCLITVEVNLVDALFEHVQGELQTALQAFEVAFVDGKARLQVAIFQQVVKARAPLIELGNIGGDEVAARRVEHLQVALIDLFRAFVIQRWFVVVVALQQFHDVEAGDDLLAVRLQVFPGLVTGGFRRKRKGAQGK